MDATTYQFSILMLSETQELARGLRRREPELFDRLIEQYHYRLFRYLFHLTGNRETAEDLFQETWIRVLEKGHQYDARRRFETWLFSIARHLAVDYFRKAGPRALDSLDDPGLAERALELPGPPERPPVDLLVEGEQSDRVNAALEQLPALYREALVLRFSEDMPLEEIAAVTSAALSTVKSRVYRGLQALRDSLETTL